MVVSVKSKSELDMFENSEILKKDMTVYLKEFSKGNKKAFNKIFPLVYRELRKNAHSLRFEFFNMETLNTTSIVHETYLKLLNSGAGSFKSRSHFYYVASRAMRQILVNASLRKRTIKRGGTEKQLSLDDIKNSIQLSDHTAEEMLQINDALKKLESENRRQARIVECRFFGGMSVEETASALDISPATVKRSWNLAKTWLYTHIHQD